MIKAVFRKDIQGLRAIALIGVMIYHVDSFLLSGFLGVDVFFTLSGFLICQLIRAELEFDVFSLKNFYLRRFWRLFPTLFVVSFLTLFVAVFTFTAEDVERINRSFLAAILSLSNFFFLFESGYWDIASAYKPLIHTWSLSVEEQFYIFFPALLGILFKKLRKWLIPSLIFLMFVSFLSNVWVDDKNLNYNFYFSPMRAFEFLMGALCSFVYAHFENKQNKWVEFFSIVGLALILIGFFQKNTTHVYSLFEILLVCTGTCFLLLTKQSYINQNLLAFSVLNWVGKHSYSIYLVHWPIISICKYMMISKPSPLDSLALVAASFVLGFFFQN